jgi:transposase
MSHYIGLDAHSQSCTLQGLTQTGKRTKLEVTKTNAGELRRVIQLYPAPRIVCLEEGTSSEWLCEVLRPFVQKIYVVQPRKRSPFKTDANDALELAEEARRGPKAVIYKPDGQLSELRTAAGNYEECLSDVARAKNRFVAAFRARGVQLPKEYSAEDSREELLELLKPPYSMHAEALARRMSAAIEARDEAAKWLINASKKVEAVRWVSSVPGIGPIRAAQIVAVVVTPHRFQRRDKFKSYSGLALRRYNSAQWAENDQGQLERRTRSRKPQGLNFNRNPILKRVFFGAALTVKRMTDHPLGALYQKLLADGQDEHLVKATIARKIALATLAVWKKKEIYDPANHIARSQQPT